MATSIHTVPIGELPFPKVTVCPPKGSNTALNPDLMMLKDKGISREDREILLKLAKELLIQGPHMVFVNTTKDLLSKNNLHKSYDGKLRKCYEGKLSFSFPWNGKFAVVDTSLAGTGWLGGNMEHIESHNWQYDMQYTIRFSDNLKELLGNKFLSITLGVDSETGVVFTGLGEPSSEQYKNTTPPWTVLKQDLTYNEQEMTFADAVTSCNDEQKYMASFTSQADMDRSNDIESSSGLWLGASYQAKLNSWQWLDGSAWNWTNWAKGEPSKKSPCAYIATFGYLERGKWIVSSSCSNRGLYQCKTFQGSHFLINGTKNMTLIYHKANFRSNSFTVRWSYNKGQRNGKQKVFLKWNIPGFEVKNNATLKNKNLVAVVNMVHKAKNTRTTAEIWLVAVTEKLVLSRKNYVYFCENNVLGQNTAKSMIEGISTKLSVPLTYEPLANGEVTEEDLETGFEMLAFLMYCPWNNDPSKCATGAKGCRTGCEGESRSYGCDWKKEWPVNTTEVVNMTLFTELFHDSAGTLVQSTAKLIEYSTDQKYLGAMMNLFGGVVGTLGLKVGKVLIAKTDKSIFGDNNTIPFFQHFQSVIDTCTNKDISQCRTTLKEVYKTDIEELSSHPVHIINKDRNFMPSALVPYCGIATDMLSLGDYMDNFTYPICTAFKPTLLEGQLCYELDTSRIKHTVKQGPHGGLFLLLDDIAENGIVIKNGVRNTNELQEKVQEKQKPGYDIAKNAASQKLMKIYIQTIQPFTFFPYLPTSKYLMTSLKIMTGTDNFLALPDEKKHCSIIPMNKCKQNQFMKKLYRDCGCTPFGLGVNQNQMIKQV